jgi:ligand-binding sensor domain-containing protein
MSNNNDTRDLPVLLRTENLPIPAPDAAPCHEIASPYHPQWLNLASQCHIRSLAVDPICGDLWLATGGGILRWWAGLDRFTRYASEHGLPGNSIKSAIVDGSGQPWAIYESTGISYLNSDTWQPYIPLTGIPVSCLCVDQTGKLWVGTGEGLYGVKAPTDEPTRVELPLHSPPPRSIAITTPDDIWLCTAQGISHRQKDTWKRYNTIPTILTLVRQGNNLWLGTLDGLIRIDLNTSQYYPAGEHRTEVSALAPTAQGVWAACGRQVGLATEDSWTPVSGKACERVTSLVPAHDNGVWIGTHAGLQWANSTTSRFQLTELPPDVVGVRSPNEPPTTFSNLVQALAMQYLPNTTLLWIGTARGLFRIDQSTETWRRPGQLGNQDIRATAMSTSGQSLWISSWSSGLYNVLPPSSLVAELPVSDPITAITAGLESGGGWAGGLAGIYGHNGTTWALVISAQKLPDAAWVRALAQTRADCLWVGTSMGLLTYNPSTKIVASATGMLGSTHIQSLLAVPTESSATLWVGTRQGLYHGQPEAWQPVAGLENRAITALTADRQANRIWVGTDRGLFCLRHTNGTWSIDDEFTVETSGLAHDRITALTLDVSPSEATRLWIGTPCGLSAHSYESG